MCVCAYARTRAFCYEKNAEKDVRPLFEHAYHTGIQHYVIPFDNWLHVQKGPSPNTMLTCIQTFRTNTSRRKTDPDFCPSPSLN